MYKLQELVSQKAKIKYLGYKLPPSLGVGCDYAEVRGKRANYIKSFFKKLMML